MAVHENEVQSNPCPVVALENLILTNTPVPVAGSTTYLQQCFGRKAPYALSGAITWDSSVTDCSQFKYFDFLQRNLISCKSSTKRAIRSFAGCPLLYNLEKYESKQISRHRLEKRFIFAWVIVVLGSWKIAI